MRDSNVSSQKKTNKDDNMTSKKNHIFFSFVSIHCSKDSASSVGFLGAWFHSNIVEEQLQEVCS